MENNKVTFTVNVSNEKREIQVYVNDKGNLVLEGIGSVTYDLLEEELELSTYDIDELN